MDYYESGESGVFERESPQRITVMLVDDHPAVLDSLMEVVETDTTLTVVATARTVSEAIRKGRMWRPEVVVLDVNMPEGGGWAAARGLLEISPDMRLIAYSSYDEALVTRTITAAGISSYVTKGSDIQNLLAAIHGEDVIPIRNSAAPLLRALAAAG